MRTSEAITKVQGSEGSISSVSAVRKKSKKIVVVTVDFDRLDVSGVKYQIALRSGSWKKKYTSSKTLRKIKVSYSKKRKKYTVTVRPFIKVSGKKYYGKVSETVKVKVRKR